MRRRTSPFWRNGEPLGWSLAGDLIGTQLHPARSNPAACDLLAGESFSLDRHPPRTDGAPARRVMGNRKDFTTDGWHLWYDRGKSPHSGSTLRILVHDNRDAADTVRAVNRWEYDCLVAYDGFAGLKAVREYRPDCMLLNIGLPGLDGYALVRRVKVLPGLGQAKLIAITAYAGKGAGVAGTGLVFFSSRGVEPVREGNATREEPCRARLHLPAEGLRHPQFAAAERGPSRIPVRGNRFGENCGRVMIPTSQPAGGMSGFSAMVSNRSREGQGVP